MSASFESIVCLLISPFLWLRDQSLVDIVTPIYSSRVPLGRTAFHFCKTVTLSKLALGLDLIVRLSH